MSPARGIPTSRAYWDLKAEQVLNRVFEPEKPIEVEVWDPPPSPEPAVDQPQPTDYLRYRNGPSTRSRTTSQISQAQHWVGQLGRRPGLLLAAAGGSVLVVSGATLIVFGLWNQSQQAIRQERNMLLIERLRTMGPATAAAIPDADHSAATPTGPGRDGELPPPPPGEPWMEELATLPASSAPSADVMRVTVNGRITSPAPTASGSGGGGGGGANGGAPQLVGVVQVPGQSGSAIFQIGGSSTSAAVGESIGSSGWRLRSASGDSAVIEKGGEQRRVNISSGF